MTEQTQRTPSLRERAERLIPGGTNTFSKRGDQFPSNAPSHILRGRAAHVWGDDEREYIDWTAALGAVSLGYDDLDVKHAVLEQVHRGSIFGLASPVEVELAEELAPLMPWPDVQFRYGKNGSDATSGAVRAARAITGRETVCSIGYHGWQDWSCPNPNGIPKSTWGLTLDRGFFDNPNAALIIEPDMIQDEQSDGLMQLRKVCDKTGALLVFDEVLTGFRTPGFTFAAHCGVTPDLICLGKAVANGSPLSIIAGPQKYMQVFGGTIGYSFTFGGEAISLAAALATVRKMKREPVIERLNEIGTTIRTHWDEQTKRLGLDIPLTGQPSRLVVRYPTPAHKTLFMERMFEQGIMWTVGATAMYAHTDEDVERTCFALTKALEVLAAAGKRPQDFIEGATVSAPYRVLA